jgi:hypothetical protein
MLADRAVNSRPARSFSKAICQGVAGLAALVVAGLLGAPAEAQTPVLHKGNAILTGFSGTAAGATPAPSGDATDNLFIDLNGASMRLQDISAGGQPPQGQLISSPTVYQAKAGDVGQVFGIALDDGRGPDGTLSATPDIYLSATSAFGLQIVQKTESGAFERMRTGNPGAQWMAGQWGDPAKAGSPGSIWKVNGTTGEISLFANVQLGGQPNAGPGLGNLTFHAKSRQIFVSDLSTGMIHRFDMRGTDLGYFDHGVQGRTSQGLAPIPDDAANRLDITNPLFNSEDATTWHFASKGRSVWGVRAHGDRLYYATAEGPQIWSISVGEDGSFGADPRLDIDVTGTPAGNAIFDLVFDGQDYLYLAQRGAARGDYAYKSFAEPAKSVVLRYRYDVPTAKWLPAPEEYAVGFPPDHRNTNGGVTLGYAYDQSGRALTGTCGRMVWSTGELLRQGSGLSGPEIVHGLQGMDRSLVRPANQPPRQSYFTDYDGTFEDPDVHAHMGDVETWQPCERSIGTLTPALPPGYIPVPPGRSNLTLTKIADPKDCVVGPKGIDCSYRIFITNAGTTIFAGPLTVNDWLPATPANAIFTFAPTPPWFCSDTSPFSASCTNAALILFPGQSTEIDVNVNLPGATPDCFLDNVAQIAWDDGVSDANPNDDVGFASAHIPNPRCLPPQGPKTNLKIKKYANPQCKRLQSGDWSCFYAVFVTNTGPGLYNGVIKVDDTLPAGATATFITPAPWTCAGGPPTYHCETTPITLTVGQSTAFGVRVIVPAAATQKDMCKVPNKVHIVAAPGGSDQNTQPTDDDDMATAGLPTEQCLGKQTNLKIEKLTGPCERHASEQGTGFACFFGIRVTNTGPGNYSGPIVIDDTYSTAPSVTAFAPQPPWTCVGAGANWQCTHPAVALAPGGHVDLLAAGLVPTGAVQQGQCALKNTASILTAVPGSAQNNVLGDDTASATAPITDPRCDKSVPTDVPGKDGHVRIEKVCKPSAAAEGLACRISITNDGGTTLAGPISFADQGTWTGNGAPLQISVATPDDPAIQCTGLPANLVCTMPGSALPAGATHVVDIVIAGGNGQTKYRNCATLVQPNRQPLATIGTPSCAEGGTGSSISVQKTAPASCSYGKDCSFQVTFTNDSDQAFSGALMVGDLMSLGGVNTSGAAIASISPPLKCDVAPAALPFTCKVAVSLAGHEVHTHTVTVRMPASPGKQGADGLNCFMAVDAAGPASPSDGLAAAAGGPGNGPGYSCVGFKMEQVESCPGDLKRIGTQCKCPEGTVQKANYKCVGNDTPPPPPPPPPKKACAAPLIGTPGNCHCPSDRPNYADGQCKPNVAKRCTPPQIGDYPNCYCPKGTSFADGDCVPPAPKRCKAPEIGTYPNCYLPKQCKSPLIGTYPNCYCPRGTTQVDGDCVPPAPKRCKAPEIGTYPNCYLPKCKLPEIGTFPNCYLPKTCKAPLIGSYPNCYLPKCKSPEIGTFPNCYLPKSCKAPQIGTYPNCSCPRGTKYIEGDCVAPPKRCQPPEIGTYPNCYVPKCKAPLIGTYPNCHPPIVINPGGPDCKGIKINGVCIGKKVDSNPPTQRACPSPAKGYYPNCKCPTELTWNGKGCSLAGNKAPAPLILKKFNLPNLQIFKPSPQVN